MAAECGPVPTNFQKHNFCEVEVLDDELVVTMRDLATDVDSVTVTLCTDVAVARERLLQRPFKTKDVEQLTFQNLTLPVHPGKPKAAKQLESTAGKCFSVPDEHAWLHPDEHGAPTDKTVEKTKKEDGGRGHAQARPAPGEEGEERGARQGGKERGERSRWFTAPFRFFQQAPVRRGQGP